MARADGGSKLSLWSEDSLLSLGSKGSVLSIGSVGSALSIGSVGSVCSAFSVGSAAARGAVMGEPDPRASLLAAGALALAAARA